MSFFSAIASSVKIAGFGVPSIPVTLTLTSSDFEYNTHDQVEANFNNRSSFATLKFSTTGTGIEVGLYTDMEDSNFSGEAKMSIYDSNMNWVHTIDVGTSAAKQTFNITLPSAGTYYLVEGAAVREVNDDQTIKSGSVVDMTGEDLALEPITLNDNCVVNIGDSISVGDNASNNSRYSYHMLLRKNMSTVDFISDGWGANYTYAHFADATARAACINRIKTEFDRRNGEKIVFLTLGVNDYGFNGIMSGIETRYAGFLDEFNAAIPTGKIVILAPIEFVNENNANTRGLILQDYRDTYQNLASTRSWVTYHNGKDFPLIQPDDYYIDGLHPNDTGHAKMATEIQTILETYIP
jgi:lysophospholipase L1-like esterase